MAHKVIDRCKETTSTTGTGTLTLTGAVANFVAMADATGGLTTDGDTSWFCAENAANAEWEVFLGTRVDATHLARTTVIASSNAGAAVSFTAPPVVFSTVPASNISAVGPSFSAYLATANQTITSSTLTKVQLNTESYDTGGCFDPATNYRFTPNVAGYYQFSWGVRCDAPATTISDAAALLYKNGAVVGNTEYVGSACSSYGASGSMLVYMNGTTDYVELYTYIAGTTPRVAFGADKTYLSGYLASLPGAPMLAPIVAPGPSFCAYRATATQSLVTATWTKAQLNAETFDTGNCFDSTTNYRFQPNVEGYYQVSFQAYVSGATLTLAESALYKNGAVVAVGTFVAAVNAATVSSGSKLVYMNGTTDYLELYVYGSGTTLVVNFGDTGTFMSASLAALPQVPQPTTGPAVRARRATSDQTITTGAWTKVQLNSEEVDTAGCFDPTTNYRWTPNVAGYYQTSFAVEFSAAGALSAIITSVYKNGTADHYGSHSPGVSSIAGASAGSGLVYMNGTTDYLELWALAVGTTPKVVNSLVTKFMGVFVRA